MRKKPRENRALSIKVALLVALMTSPDMVRADPSFDSRVIEAILANPEVVLMALGKLKAEEETAAQTEQVSVIRATAEDLFGERAATHDPVIAEFFDYRCGYCAQASDIVVKIEQDLPGSVVYIELPILGDVSTELARFALAVKQVYGSKAYTEFHHAMMQATPASRSLGGAARLAATMELNVGEIERASFSPSIDNQIRRNKQLAAQLGISGTPAFVGRNSILSGFAGYDALKSLAKEDNGS